MMTEDGVIKMSASSNSNLSSEEWKLAQSSMKKLNDEMRGEPLPFKKPDTEKVEKFIQRTYREQNVDVDNRKIKTAVLSVEKSQNPREVKGSFEIKVISQKESKSLFLGGITDSIYVNVLYVMIFTFILGHFFYLADSIKDMAFENRMDELRKDLAVTKKVYESQPLLKMTPDSNLLSSSTYDETLGRYLSLNHKTQEISWSYNGSGQIGVAPGKDKKHVTVSLSGLSKKECHWFESYLEKNDQADKSSVQFNQDNENGECGLHQGNRITYQQE